MAGPAFGAALEIVCSFDGSNIDVNGYKNQEAVNNYMDLDLSGNPPSIVNYTTNNKFINNQQVIRVLDMIKDGCASKSINISKLIISMFSPGEIFKSFINYPNLDISGYANKKDEILKAIQDQASTDKSTQTYSLLRQKKNGRAIYTPIDPSGIDTMNVFDESGISVKSIFTNCTTWGNFANSKFDTATSASQPV